MKEDCRLIIVFSDDGNGITTNRWSVDDIYDYQKIVIINKNVSDFIMIQLVYIIYHHCNLAEITYLTPVQKKTEDDKWGLKLIKKIVDTVGVWDSKEYDSKFFRDIDMNTKVSYVGDETDNTPRDEYIKRVERLVNDKADRNYRAVDMDSIDSMFYDETYNDDVELTTNFNSMGRFTKYVGFFKKLGGVPKIDINNKNPNAFASMKFKSRKIELLDPHSIKVFAELSNKSVCGISVFSDGALTLEFGLQTMNNKGEINE